MTKLTYIAFIFFMFLAACELIDDEDESTPDANSDVALSDDSIVTDSEGNVYSVGFDQASGNNQNPFVEKKGSDGNRIWRIAHETTGVDGRVTMIVLDADDNPWVVFTVDGGSNSGNYINQKEIESGAFSNVYSNSYGSGGGPKVAVVARLNPKNGKIVKGSFITARLTNGRTNTLSITKIGFQNGNFAFEISSAAWPPGTGSRYQRFPEITDDDRINNRFKIYYEMSLDLSEIVDAVLLRE